MESNQLQSQNQHSRSNFPTNHRNFLKQLFSELIRESFKPALLRADMRKPSKEYLWSLLHTSCRYHETTTRQPAWLVEKMLHLFLHHQAADTATTNQQALAFFVAASHIMLQHLSPRVINVLGPSSEFIGHIHIPPVNQRYHKPGHQSYSLYDICIHIFDRLQLYLRPDHTATPTICIKYRDNPNHLEALSPWTYRQPSLRFSTVLYN